MIMIEKNIKTIIRGKGKTKLDLSEHDIKIYPAEVKDAVQKGQYRIALGPKRQDNLDLFLTYLVDEAKAKEILLGLTADDFSEAVWNEHKGYEDELLYAFGKKAELLERAGSATKTVALYIKFNKLDSCYVIVISFHGQKYPINYYFRK